MVACLLRSNLGASGVAFEFNWGGELDQVAALAGDALAQVVAAIGEEVHAPFPFLRLIFRQD